MKHISLRRLFRINPLLYRLGVMKWGLILMIGCCSSGCGDVTAFGGKTLNSPSDFSGGGALGVLAFEAEIGTIGTRVNYSFDFRLSRGLPEMEDVVWFPYLLMGSGGMDGHATFNCGGGFGLAPWRLAAKWKQSSPVIRLDYRYFGFVGGDNIQRVYIGLWGSHYAPLFGEF